MSWVRGAAWRPNVTGAFSGNSELHGWVRGSLLPSWVLVLQVVDPILVQEHGVYWRSSLISLKAKMTQSSYWQANYHIRVATNNIWTTHPTRSDNSNKRCLSNTMCNFESSRKFWRASRFFWLHSRKNVKLCCFFLQYPGSMSYFPEKSPDPRQNLRVPGRILVFSRNRPC